MKKELFLAVVITLSVLMPVHIPKVSTISNVTLGVKIGDFVHYSVNVTGVPELEGLAFLNVSVAAIDGTVVTEKIVYEYSNSSTSTEYRKVDVSTQADFVTSANLNLGDTRSVPPPGGNITATAILYRNYYGAIREVVLFNQTEEGRIFLSYYDRQTGFLLESYYELTFLGIKSTITYSIHTTNLWTQSQPSTLEWVFNWIQKKLSYIVVGTLIIIIALIIFVVKRKRFMHDVV